MPLGPRGILRPGRISAHNYLRMYRIKRIYEPVAKTDGYRIRIRAAPNDDRLMTFALEFRGAWLAAAPSET